MPRGARAWMRRRSAPPSARRWTPPCDAAAGIHRRIPTTRGHRIPDCARAGRGAACTMTAASAPARPAPLPPQRRWDAAPMLEAARADAEEALRRAGSSPAGLTAAEAARRLGAYGPNEIATERPVGWPRRLLRTLRNPLVILL